MNDSAFSTEHHAAVPFWRDVRVLRWLFQIAILVFVVLLFIFLGTNLQQNLQDIGLNLRSDFLSRPAGFNISEGPAFERTQTNLQAYQVGLVNTLRVSVLGITLATVLGTIVGIARLSTNWLLSRIALVYIEIMQNTPLLVQLFFWFVLIRALPRQRRGEVIAIPPEGFHLGSLEIPPLAYFSQRAAALPGLETLPSFSQWWPFILVGLVVAAVAWWYRVWSKEREGRPAIGQMWLALIALLLVLAIGWLIVPGAPLKISIPVLEGEGIIINYAGGWELSNNFQALLVGLVLYTAAFIAESVRSGIQAVNYGQIEAATALGFTINQRLRLIILPQALRVIIPPMINQYLNLVKNSSLAIAVAYPDMFNIATTVGNQTGQTVQIIGIVMGSYLVFSITISLIMNFVNRRIQIVER